MRYIPLIYQNTKACNALFREDMEIRALMHGGGQEG
jgi:hypothetical protein